MNRPYRAGCPEMVLILIGVTALVVLAALLHRRRAPLRPRTPPPLFEQIVQRVPLPPSPRRRRPRMPKAPY
ncbi:MAG: hypothetical protein N838_05470 [Thiohalocapsa sp. PB-PSB1]|nr:MAG: hypothetical protein N838_05470 [Thiohalocapsa sp. PB-PSB1]